MTATTNMNHSVGHFEVPVDSTEELKSFYSSLLNGNLKEDRLETIG